MLETVTDIFLVLARVLTILPLLFFTTIFMGKRAIGEIPVFDFLIILILGAVVGADIADVNIKHFPTIVTILFIGLFQRVVANWRLSNRKLRTLMTLEPIVVIQDGTFIFSNLRKIRYTIGDILQMLRNKDIFDINEVQTAIIEGSGSLSVLKKYEKTTVAREDLNLVKKTSIISYPVIIEGHIYIEPLNSLGVDEKWLRHELTIQGITKLDEIFFASINDNKELHVSLKMEYEIKLPPLKH